MFEFHGTFLPILKFWSYALKYFEIIITTQFGWNGTLPRNKKGEKGGNEGSQSARVDNELASAQRPRRSFSATV